MAALAAVVGLTGRQGESRPPAIGRGAVRAIRRRPRLVASFVIGATVVWLFSASLLGGKVLSAGDMLLFNPPYAQDKPAELKHPSNFLLLDAVYQFTPELQYAREQVRDLRLPLWNPGFSAGRPLLADQQNASLYPLNWPAYVLPFWKSLGWIVALKLFLACLGAFAFCRSLRLSLAPSLIGGLAFGLSTFLVTQAEHPTINVYLLLPWLMLAVERLCARGDPRHLLILGGLVGLAFLGGHPESVVVCMLGVVPYAAFRLLSMRRSGEIDRAVVRRRAALFAGGCVLGTAVGAVMLIPLAELISQGSSAVRERAAPSATEIATLGAPQFWGRLDRAVQMPTNAWPAYVGVLPLLLAVGGIAARRSSNQLFFASLAAGSLLLAVRTPFVKVSDAIRELPGVSAVDLNRVLVLVALAMAVLAAYGLQIVLTATPAERRRVLIAMSAVAAVPLIWLAVRADAVTANWHAAFANLPAVGANEIRLEVVHVASMLRWLALAAIGIGIVLLLMWWRRRQVAIAALAVVFVAADLVSVSRGYHPAIDRSIASPALPPTIAYLQRHEGASRSTGDLGTLGPELGLRFGLHDVAGLGPPVLKRYADLFEALGGARRGSETVYRAGPRTRRLLDVFAVRYVLAKQVIPVRGRPDGLGSAFSAADGSVLVNRTAFPRAWIAYSWRPAASLDQALGAAASSSPRTLRDAPLIEGVSRPPPGPPPAPTPARLRQISDTRLALHLRARQAGYLVLDDSYYPGWAASVDGREVPIHPANAAFRAVRVPAGRHLVTFSYRPLTALWGGIVSLLASAAILIGLLASRLRRRRLQGR